jgi:hypothetical protein
MTARLVDDPEDFGERYLDIQPINEREGLNRYVPDGREGTDRWGNKREDKTACGTGFGPGGYSWPLYLEESCPGERQPRVRNMAPEFFVCDMFCGTCGGGSRDNTINYCGHAKGHPFTQYAMWEFDGSLRLDRMGTDLRPKAPEAWPTSFFPSVEWGAKTWVGELANINDGREWPMLTTTLKTAWPGNRKDPQPLRERLGGYGGMVVVNGLTKDRHLDMVWDNRRRVMEFCKTSGVDVMVAPQFSYYDDDPMAMWVYNAARTFRYYEECVELGFPVSCLHMPPWAQPWYLDEWHDYVARNGVKCMSFSFQTLTQLQGRHIWAMRKLHAELDPDVAVIIFGSTSIANTAILARCYPGRNITFCNVEAYAKAAFFRLFNDERAPPGWSKGEAFAWSVDKYSQLVQRVVAATAAGGDEPDGDRPRARRVRTRRSATRAPAERQRRPRAKRQPRPGGRSGSRRRASPDDTA